MSLWDRFWSWFWEQFYRLTQRKWGFGIFIWVFSISLILFALVKLSGMEKRFFLQGDLRNKGLNYREEQENIHNIDFDTAINDAIFHQQYRNAIRLMYLHNLKILSDRNMITFTLNKTNYDYSGELKNTSLAKGFTETTMLYEYAWYGAFPIQKETLEKLRDIFYEYKNYSLMKWMRWYSVLIAILLTAYVYAIYKKPVAINWERTLSSKDKIPYGSFIVYHELRAIMGILPTESRVPVYELLNDSVDSGEVYMLVNNEIRTTPTDEQELFQYLNNGNTVFISTEGLSKTLSDTLKLSLQNFYFGEVGGDSTAINFVSPVLQRNSDYRMPAHTVDGYFKYFDTANAVVLGINNHGKANYIRMNVGKGWLYLHAAPMVFTNFFVLNSANREYMEKTLSYLPGVADRLYWDEYYKIGRGGPSTPLRVILTRAELKWAYITALITIILFMIFQSKRRQRIIPVIPPTINNTVDFIETVSGAYLNDHNHRNIALKKLTYLFEHIRTKFFLNTLIIDDEFTERLSQKSGLPISNTKEMVALIQYIRSQERISDQHLIKLNYFIDDFHKYSPR